MLGESACYDACEGYCQTPLFEEFTLALFDPSSNTRVPVWCGGPIAKLVKLQESFCRRHHVMLPPVKKRFDYHTLILFYKIKSNLAPAYLTELLPSPSHNSGHTFRKELYPVPLVKKIVLLSLVFCHARLFFGIAYRQNCRRAPLLARLSQL